MTSPHQKSQNKTIVIVLLVLTAALGAYLIWQVFREPSYFPVQKGKSRFRAIERDGRD
jgi:hypothetical protein